MKTKTITMKDVPIYVAGSFDPLAHTRIADIRDLVRHELDLYYEGEDNDIKNEITARQARKYLTSK